MIKKISKILVLMIVITIMATTLIFAAETSTGNREDQIIVGMEAAYAPYNWTQFDDSNGAVKISNSDGYASGYDVEIAKIIAEKLGKELVIEKHVWDGLIPALQSKKIDIIIAGMSDTEERRNSIDFSNSYYSSDMVIVLNKNSPFVEAKSLEDFASAKLTGQMGTVHYDLLDEMPDIDKQPALEDFGTMILATNSGRIDGYISEVPGALAAQISNKTLTYVEFPEGKGFSEQVSVEVGVFKGDKLLASDINKILKEITPLEKAEIMNNAVETQPVEEGVGFFGNVKRIFNDYGGLFLKGAVMTLFIALIGTIIGSFIGILAGAVRNIPYERRSDLEKNSFSFRNIVLRIVHILIFLYVEIFRGTPMMVQAMVLYYGIPLMFGVEGMNALTASILILSINTGAYMTEVVRGGIEGVDKGQTEAGKAIGMSHSQVMRSIVLPQAIRRILPATGNEFVINIKDTSVLNVITLAELFYNTKVVATATYLSFEPYLMSAVFYLVMTVTVTQILRFVERKMDGDHHFTRTSSTMPDHKLNHKSYGKVKKGRRVLR